MPSTEDVAELIYDVVKHNHLSDDYELAIHQVVTILELLVHDRQLEALTADKGLPEPDLRGGSVSLLPPRQVTFEELIVPAEPVPEVPMPPPERPSVSTVDILAAIKEQHPDLKVRPEDSGFPPGTQIVEGD